MKRRPCASLGVSNPVPARTLTIMGNYRFYELDRFNHIKAGHSVECGSDTAARRAAGTLLRRSARVEVWKRDHCVAHMTNERLWDQLRVDWMPI